MLRRVLGQGVLVGSGGSDREVARALGLVSAIGGVFAISVALGLGLGLLVSRVVGGGVPAVAAGLLLGALAGGWNVYRMVMRSLDT